MLRCLPASISSGLQCDTSLTQPSPCSRSSGQECLISFLRGFLFSPAPFEDDMDSFTRRTDTPEFWSVFRHARPSRPTSFCRGSRRPRMTSPPAARISREKGLTEKRKIEKDKSGVTSVGDDHSWRSPLSRFWISRWGRGRVSRGVAMTSPAVAWTEWWAAVGLLKKAHCEVEHRGPQVKETVFVRFMTWQDIDGKKMRQNVPLKLKKCLTLVKVWKIARKRVSFSSDRRREIRVVLIYCAFLERHFPADQKNTLSSRPIFKFSIPTLPQKVPWHDISFVTLLSRWPLASPFSRAIAFSPPLPGLHDQLRHRRLLLRFLHRPQDPESHVWGSPRQSF